MTISDPLRAFAEAKPSNWQLLPFADVLAEPVRNGVYKEKAFHGRGVRVVNMGELFDYSFISAQEMKRVELTSEEATKSGLLDGDLLFARRSLVLEGAGKCSLVVNPPETLTFESSLIRARPDRTVVEPRYLYYLFSSPLGRAIMASIATRTAVSGIRGSDLSQIGLPIPPLPVQRRIASILSAYDDLIENNRKRIAILEDMARRLYREWFVHFRYPGHESVPLVDSSLGRIPQGWEVAKVGSALSVLGGGTPSRTVDEYWQNGSINWFTPSDLTAAKSMYLDESSEKISELGLRESSAKLFPAMSVMMTSRATIGVVAINATPATTNQGFITVVPNERIRLQYLYQWMRFNVPMFDLHASGATFKELSRGNFKNFDIVVPSQGIAAQFEKMANPMGELNNNLSRQIAILRRTRDLLLPRLMSGQLAVEAAEAAVP